MVFNPAHVVSGPGTLYAAPLGSTEPTAASGAWPTGWVALGYTDQGSDWTFTPTFQELTVEEEYWPVRQVPNGAKAEVTFALAETTASNLLLVLNDGFGSSVLSAATGTNGGDSSIWVEPPTLGQEVRVMIGWDSFIEGASTGTSFGRFFLRQALQTGAVKRTARKGNNKAMYAATFAAEKPAGLQPFRFILPPGFAA